MKKEPLESIASSARIFLWIFGIPSLAASALLILLTFMAIRAIRDDWNSERTRLVAAAEDLPAGTVLTANNIGKKTFLDRDLKTDDWIDTRSWHVLLGHRVLAPVSRLEPIEWRNTDIVITNWESLQQAESTVPVKDAPSASSPVR
jgi:Flp pilus assembly protein CpaB